MAKERGATVIVIDRTSSRLDQARRFGADHTLSMQDLPSIDDRFAAARGLTAGEGPDIALEVTGAPETLSEGLQQIRRGGRYLVMGNLSPGASVPFDPGYVTRKALTIKHVDRYEGRYLFKSLRFLSRHQSAYPFHTLVDATFDLDEVEEALEKSLACEVTRAAIVINDSRTRTSEL